MKITKQFKTESITQVLIAGLLVFSAESVFARSGPQTGGGGFAVYCPETPVAKESVVVLDLYEGRREVHGRRYVQAGQDLMETYKNVVRNTYKRQGYPDAFDNTDTEDHLQRFFQSVKFVNTADEMPVANDLGATVGIPSQCQLAQIAFFADSRDVIYILKPAWDKLDLLNQAALVLHELHGFALRSIQNVKSSVSARKFTAAAMTTTGVKENIQEAMQRLQSLHAQSIDGRRLLTVFRVLPFTDSSITRLFITNLFGVGLTSEAYVDLPLADIKLKRKISDQNEIVYELANENLDQVNELVINGAQTNHLKVRVVLKTGEPVKISLVEDGAAKLESWLAP